MKKSLYFNCIGKGTPLALLHGWGWSSQIWEPLIPLLSQRFQLFLIDLPGFGKSPLAADDYTFKAIAPLLFDCVPDKALWLGWSLGGMFTWWIAANYPEKVEKLITVSASPRFVQDGAWPGISAPTLLQFAASLKNNVEKTLTDFLELQLRGSPDYQSLLEILQRQVRGAPPQLPALEGGLKLLQTVDLRNELQKVKCPSLHVFGERDRIVPAEVAQFLPIGQSEVISKSGHLPFLSQQEIFLNAVFTFADV
jgi:pimeloyl-[acyl-carrier protein] methyl ester esterase